MLPDSEGVATVDVKRLFNEAVPSLLASKPAVINDITAKVDEFREFTGVDVRKFDLIVAGINSKKVGTKIEPEAVIIARGEIDSAGVISAAKKAADNKYKEESIGSKTIYVFSAKEIAEKIKEKAARSASEENKETVDKAWAMNISDLAISAHDANTVIFGNVERVRAAAEGKTKVSAQLTTLLNRKQFAVINFAAMMPAGMGEFVPVDNDELGAGINNIKSVFGSADIIDGNTSFSITAKLAQKADAEAFQDLLTVLQTFGKGALGSSKRTDQKLYARLLGNAKLSRVGADISLDINVPKADMDQLMGILIK